MEKVEYSIKEKIHKTITMSILCIIMMMILCSHFFKTNFTDNLMKLIGKSDKRDYPYIIYNKDRYDLPNIENNIYCGRALWRDDKVLILLLIGEEEKKNRLMIDKKDIYPLQGKDRLTYCNKGTYLPNLAKIKQNSSAYQPKHST